MKDENLKQAVRNMAAINENKVKSNPYLSGDAR